MAERAVLPIENSLGGSIHTVYDLLLRYRLHIVGETSIAVNHCLMALPGTKTEEVRRVMSHPQVGRQAGTGEAGRCWGRGRELARRAGRAGRCPWLAGRERPQRRLPAAPLPAHLCTPDPCTAAAAASAPLQALAQTDGYLRRLNVIKEAVDDTAGAAQMIARQQLKVRRGQWGRWAGL
jgi:hypothetical protein